MSRFFTQFMGGYESLVSERGFDPIDARGKNLGEAAEEFHNLACFAGRAQDRILQLPEEKLILMVFAGLALIPLNKYRDCDTIKARFDEKAYEKFLIANQAFVDFTIRGRDNLTETEYHSLGSSCSFADRLYQEGFAQLEGFPPRPSPYSDGFPRLTIPERKTG